MNSKPILKVGIVAGEYSGDRLGTKIIKSLAKTHDIELYGVGGPKLIKQGLKPLFDFKKLHVMGLIEPLLNLRELIKFRKLLINLFIEKEIDYFIGVDSPDFNISIHKALKLKNTCKNIQVVSPSVWVWRENRIKDIKKYIDLTACLFNFEDNFYKKKNLPSIHVGHPFSKLFPKNKEIVFKNFNLDPSKKFVSILPGSRKSEIKNLLPTYIEFIILHSSKYSHYEYLIPASDNQSLDMIKKDIPPDLPVVVGINCTKDFLSISDFSVVTSGTATLESAVLGTSPIICYKTNPINYFIISRMLKIDDVGLPNLLLGKRKFPELIQRSCNAKSILDAAESIKNNNDAENISITLRNLLIGLSPEESAQKILSL